MNSRFSLNCCNYLLPLEIKSISRRLDDINNKIIIQIFYVTITCTLNHMYVTCISHDFGMHTVTVFVQGSVYDILS